MLRDAACMQPDLLEYVRKLRLFLQTRVHSLRPRQLHVRRRRRMLRDAACMQPDLLEYVRKLRLFLQTRVHSLRPRQLHLRR
ncbi:unnamed protein product [Ixodes persulcatus]